MLVIISNKKYILKVLLNMLSIFFCLNPGS